MRVRIDFDPAKDAANVAKHGVSLAKAVDLDVLTVEEDMRFAYPEMRYRAFGLIDGVPFCLAYTRRDSMLRAISLRRAHIKEFRRHVS